MPVSKYYKGHGKEVMADMEKRYGDKKGKQVFYATANKRGLTPGSLDDIEALDFRGEGQTTLRLNQMSTTEPGAEGQASIDGREQLVNGYRAAGVGRDIPVALYGPDSSYEAIEINVDGYGQDYDPLPGYGVKSVKKLHKKEDEQEEGGNLRMREDFEYAADDEQCGAFSNRLAVQRGALKRLDRPDRLSVDEIDEGGDVEGVITSQAPRHR